MHARDVVRGVCNEVKEKTRQVSAEKTSAKVSPIEFPQVYVAYASLSDFNPPTSVQWKKQQ